MKLTLAIKKHTAQSSGFCESHNTRLQEPKSQIEDERAWFLKQASLSTEWRGARLDQAKALARRKDAVVALELVVQVGNQSDWRELPTPEHPFGKPKKPPPMPMQTISKAAQAAIVAEFGAENIVNMAVHFDESTPHVHFVVTPIKDGKLNQKHWIGGFTAITALRKRLHVNMQKGGVACEYTPGGPGGDPHEPKLGAGASEAVKLRAERDLHAKKAQDLFSKVKALEARNRVLEDELKRLGVKLEWKPEPAAPAPAPAQGRMSLAERVQARAAANKGEGIEMNRTPTADEKAGMDWWNNMDERQRREWLDKAGSARPADAWERFKRERRPQAPAAKEVSRDR